MSTGAVEPMVDRGTDTQDPQEPPSTVRQGVVDRLDERGQIGRGVVIDEDDLVVIADNISAMQFRLMAARLWRL